MMTSRRTFLKTSAAALLGFPAIVRAVNQNSQLQIAAIGVSGKGFSDISEVGTHSRVRYVGFCDIDTSRFGQVDKKFPDVAHFQDFREMLAQLGDKCDAVIVSTPDHLHAPVAMAAMQRGKHVYCQKPLTHTVWEARQLRLQAAKAKVVTQMGNQIHSAAEYRTAVKLLREGAIGKVKEVHSFLPNRGNNYTKLTEPPAPGTALTADKTVPVTWYDGGRMPDASVAQLPADKKLPGGGSIIVGESSTMVLPHVGMPQVYSKGEVALLGIEKVPGVSHYHAWVDAVLSGTKTTDSFDYAGPLTEAVQLGNVATRVPGVTLEWDAEALRIRNSPEAERLLTKEYRDAWKIEAVV
jgi:hypothetical protein